MYWHAAGVCILSTAVIAGCANSPPNQPDDVIEAGEVIEADEVRASYPDGAGVIEEHLSDADVKKMAGCRKEKPTGSRFPRWVCEPAKDDRDLLSVIGGSTEHW